MTYPGLHPGARPVAAPASGLRRLRPPAGTAARQALRGFRREVAARTCARLRRETRLQLQAMRQLLHTLFD